MRVRWLGWAGVEIEAAGEVLVIDPLSDPAAHSRPSVTRRETSRCQTLSRPSPSVRRPPGW